MELLLVILLCSFAYSSPPSLEENVREAVEPEYLDMLLMEGNYEEFSRLMAIDVPHLSHPRDENVKHDPRFSPYLEHGDILRSPKQSEQSREGINLGKWPGSKWSGNVVPYYISSTNYTAAEKQNITKFIEKCNQDLGGCVVYVPYQQTIHKDYVFIFSGKGCYSNVGRIGKQQPLSLSKNGCLYPGTVCHELLHALGFSHQQSRCDRDNYIEIIWKNFNEGWDTQFDMVPCKEYVNCDYYDLKSIMHYPRRHPDLSNNTIVFNIKEKINFDPELIGRAQNMSELDIRKVKNLYCANTCRTY